MHPITIAGLRRGIGGTILKAGIHGVRFTGMIIITIVTITTHGTGITIIILIGTAFADIIQTGMAETEENRLYIITTGEVEFITGRIKAVRQ